MNIYNVPEIFMKSMASKFVSWCSAFRIPFCIKKILSEWIGQILFLA